MTKRILIAYASKSGTTAEVAQKMAEMFCGDDLPCQEDVIIDLRPFEFVHAIEGYDAAILGSAVRMEHWLPEARHFVESHQETLGTIPVITFTMCMTLAQGTQKAKELASHYTDDIRAMIAPRAEAFFSGALFTDRLSFPLRLITNAKNMPAGDFRDWDAIGEWVKHIRLFLLAELEVS